MNKISFNDTWICYRSGHPEEGFPTDVPHDAMLLDGKSETSPGGVNTGWYDAQDYTYEKNFFVPAEWNGKVLILEFEGVYRKATVSVNGRKAAYHDYGYTGFYVDISEFVSYGEKNHLKVEVVNSDQPNSRWYSGTGIYRPVWLYTLPLNHIKMDGIRIATLDYETRRISVSVETVGNGELQFEILDEERLIAGKKSVSGNGQELWEVSIPDAGLWSPESPKLYTCRVTFGEDVREVKFGIRTVECSPDKGFCINGERVILRGACIHHDNGLLGACAYDFAERRKIRILKENGYNAIRSAHNPCSKAMLDACDDMGMLVMDEYIDVWYIHKTKYDYATEVEKNFRQDLADIVAKDYNHPSVVLYSTGNEVSETAQKKGIRLCGELTGRFHELDPTRPVTCGINIFFNFLSSMGFGVYSDKKADQAVENVKKKKAVGSEFFNKLSGIMGADFMKFGATLYPCDLKTKDAFANMDIAGYNYGINRYIHDLKKYPNRMILGSETFCSDAYRFWELTKENKRIIGDFVWAGMDYLGEVGVGSWEYKDYAPRFDWGKGWVSAGSGRIDLTGKPLAEMAYTRVAFGLQDIAIGVIPVDNTNSPHSPSAWKMTNAVESWSWNGCDGKEAKVEIYARAHHVSLYINGKCVGTKQMKHDCRAIFKTVYQPGEIRAEAFDAHGNKIAECSLKTAGDETKLTLEPELKSVTADDLLYVRMKYTDEKGTVKPLVRGEIKVNVSGGKLIGIGSACPYYEKSYLGDTADTYYGEALAVIRPDKSGKIIVDAQSRYGDAQTEVDVL